MSFENRQAIDLLLELDYPEPLLIGELRNQLFLKLNHHAVANQAAEVKPEVSALPSQFTLARPGARRRGRVVFEIPDVDLSALSLVYVPEKFPAMEVLLAGGAPPPAPEPLASGTSKDFLTLRVEEIELVETYRDVPAPGGMRWAVVKLAGISRLMRTLDARAVDVEAAVDAKIDVPRAAVYLKAPDLLQLVVDGRHAHVRNPRLSTLVPEPAFPSGDPAGGAAVFPVPADAVSLELFADFPSFRGTGGARDPDPIQLPLREAEEPLDPPAPLAEVEDAPLPLTVDAAQYDKDTGEVRVEVTLRNTGEEGGMYEASSRANIQLPDGSTLSPDRVEIKGGIAAREPFWIPGGDLPRSFAYVFRVSDSAASVRFAYGGVKRSGAVTLDLETVDGEGALTANDVETEAEGSGTGLASTRVLDQALAPERQTPLELNPVTWEAPEKEDEDEVVIDPPGDGTEVGRRLRGDGFSLTAHRLFALEEYYGKETDDGVIWLAVELEWALEPGAESVKIADIQENLPMVVDGRRLQSMVWFGGTDPQSPNQVSLDAETPSLRRFVFYPVSAAGVVSAELLWTGGQGVPRALSLLPLDGKVPESPEPAALAQNRAVELGLYGAEPRERFAGYSPGEDAWLVVDVRGRSRMRSEEGAPLPYVWREWRPRMQLILDGVQAIPAKHKRNDFDPKARLLPEWMTGGEFAFDVSREDLASATLVQLQCGFAPVAIPGDRVRPLETLYFTLKGDPADLQPPPEPYKSLEDMDFKIDVVEVSRPDEVTGRKAGSGKSWVRVDFGVEGLAEAGVWFSARETLKLIRPDRLTLSPHRYAYRRGDAPPNGGKSAWIPKGGRREFRLVWEVPDDAGTPRLRIEGVKLFQAVGLFPEGSEATDIPDPEANRAIDENGLPVLRPSAEPGGIESVGLQPAQVNESIDRGRDFLWRRLQEEWKGLSPRWYADEHILAILALVHADAHLEYPAFDKALRRFLRVIRIEDNRVYENALVAMIIEGYGDPSFLPKMEQVAHWLVETQGEEGTWTYKAPFPGRFFPEPEPEEEDPDGFLSIEGGEVVDPYEPPKTPVHRTQSWELGKNGDHSCTQFAVLGLWSAERSGVDIDSDVWRRVATRMARHQTLRTGERYGGYGYRGQGGGYGSMTAAGICTLAIAMNRLFDEMTPREHLRIRNSLGWMVRNFTVKENPESKKYNYYYTYSVERVGRILGIDFMGDHEWYPAGAKYLVDTQAGDGSWPTKKGETDTFLTTSYALLFLTRATPELDAEPEPEPEGPGTLATRVERPESRPNVYLILDVSGSMRAPVDGEMKLDIARGAIRDMLEALPQGTRVAVRAYGHRKRSIDSGADEDTELIVPWTEVESKKIMGTLDALRPRGKTPMALSLKQAAGDIGRGNDETILVLLTDGGERSRTTDPVKEAAAFADRKDVSFFLLGFDINREHWTRQLRSMAEAGGGVYRPVEEADKLTRDLRAAVFPPVPAFEVLDKKGKVVATSEFGGEALELEPGDYNLRAKAPDFSLPFRIRPGGRTRITLDMARLADAGGEGDEAP